MLLPLIATDTNVQIDVLVVGTGQALTLAARGDVDAVLVHAPTAEKAHIAAGHAPYRREIMYNDFVIVGPKRGAAALAATGSAANALAYIAQNALPFVSRADDSGTHKAELRLWRVPPKGRWYHETGSGMGATLNTGVALGAYVLTDRASWLNFGNRPDTMGIVFEGDSALFNQYSFLPVPNHRHPHVAADAAGKVETWLTSAKGQAHIAAYRVQGVQLFFPNAQHIGGVE